MTRKENIAGAEKMGTGPIPKLLTSMALPAIFSMSINALYNIVDSIFVAKISQDALTAVSFVMPMQFVMIAFSVGSGVGVNSLISRKLGAQKKEEADSAASASVRIAYFNYILFLLIGLFVTVPFMNHYTSDPVLLGYGISYMRIVMCFGIFLSLEIMLEKIMQATGDMISPMICSLSGALTNIILDPILIFGLFGAPRLEVRGAAIATVIGQVVSFLVAVFILIKKDHEVKIKLLGYKMRFDVFAEIYKVGFPSIIMQIIASVMLIGFNTILAAETTAVAVLGIYFKLQSFVFMPVFGLNQGAMPLMGYNYGAKNKVRLIKTFKLALFAAFVIMTLGTLMFQLIPDLLLRLFNAGEEMLRIGIPALRIISICFIPAAFGIITATFFQGTGHGFYSLLASLIRQLLGILPLAFILYRLKSVTGAWFAFPLAEVLGFTFSAIMLYRLYKKEIKDLDLADAE